jgi:sporulation protein YlmC with PRC-barrel domain
MSYRIAALIGGVLFVQIPTSFAADPLAEPQMNTGYTNIAPRKPTVSENADQMRARNAVGAAVRDGSGAVVAKINDLIVNRSDGTVQLAVLELMGDKSDRRRRAAVAWSSLRFEGKPTPHFLTSLSTQELATGTSFKQQAQNREDFYDVKTDLLGKAVTGADGAQIGKIQDLVVHFGDGRLAAIVIDTGGLIAGARYHAVDWDKAQPQGGKSSTSVGLALSKSQVNSAPVMTTLAPRPVPTQTDVSTPMINQGSTGNISGTRIPASPTRRE